MRSIRRMRTWEPANSIALRWASRANLMSHPSMSSNSTLSPNTMTPTDRGSSSEASTPAADALLVAECAGDATRRPWRGVARLLDALLGVVDRFRGEDAGTTMLTRRLDVAIACCRPVDQLGLASDVGWQLKQGGKQRARPGPPMALAQGTAL